MDGLDGADGQGVGGVPAAAGAFEAEGFALAWGCREGSLRSTVGPLPMSRPAAAHGLASTAPTA